MFDTPVTVPLSIDTDKFWSSSLSKLSIVFFCTEWLKAGTVLIVSHIWFSTNLSACRKSTIRLIYPSLPLSCSLKITWAQSRMQAFWLYACMQLCTLQMTYYALCVSFSLCLLTSIYAVLKCSLPETYGVFSCLFIPTPQKMVPHIKIGKIGVPVVRIYEMINYM